jgi:thiol-disulfide isomerase/thioredoxin
VSEFERESRADPIEFAGVDEYGTDRESQEYLGDVLVVNFWYAACPPCRVEAPWLEELSAKYSGEGVSFLGVNVRDSADTAKSFAETFGIGYPSLIDDQGAIALAFAGVASPTAVPTTVVLDKHGRPASRIVGLIDKSVLETLIVSALDEEYE